MRLISCHKCFGRICLNLHGVALAPTDLLAHISPLHKWGIFSSGLEFPQATHFASSSSLSFSLTPSCPGIHMNSNTPFPCWLWAASIFSCNWLTRCFPGAPLMFLGSDCHLEVSPYHCSFHSSFPSDKFGCQGEPHYLGLKYYRSTFIPIVLS